MILLDDQDKEHVHRACIPNEKQGKLREFEVGCNTNHTDIKFRRPDGTVRYFVLLIQKFWITNCIILTRLYSKHFQFQRIKPVTVCGCKTDLCNESVVVAESNGIRWCPALATLIFSIAILLNLSQ